jgi:hypothetical protein
MNCETALPDLLAPHDVSGGTHERTLVVVLDSEDTITSATVKVVDPDTHAPIVGDTLRIVGDAAGSTTLLTWGFVKSDADGDWWGVNFWMLEGSPQLYGLELEYYTASQPDAPQYPQFYRVEAIA